MTACCLCLLLVLKPVPAIRPHNVHMQPHMHSVLCSIAWLTVGTNELCHKKRPQHSFVCLLWCWLITRNWNYFAFAFVILPFIFINPKRFFMMPFVVFAAPFSSPKFCFHLPAHYNAPALSIMSSLSSPAMHLGIPQDMESDPDDEVKQILHHHMELLLLCRPFCWLDCRCCSKYTCRKHFVPVQYFGVKDASDCTFFYAAASLLKWPLVVHEWKWKLFKSARVSLLLTSSQVQWSRLLCHTSACFSSLSSFPYMFNRISPCLHTYY